MLARVASRGEHHGVIVLAGIPLRAQLPEDVQAGATLRLKVEEVTPERVTLRVDPDVAAAAAAPAPAPPPRARVAVQEPPPRRAAGGEPVDVVALAFQSPALGRLDLRLELRGGHLLAAIGAAAGKPYDVASAEGERLRANLERSGLNATVRVSARREPVDLYA